MLDEHLLKRNPPPPESAALSARRVEVIGRDLPDLVNVPSKESVVAARGAQTELPQRLGVRQRGGDRLSCRVFIISRHERMFASRPDDTPE